MEMCINISVTTSGFMLLQSQNLRFGPLYITYKTVKTKGDKRGMGDEISLVHPTDQYKKDQTSFFLFA